MELHCFPNRVNSTSLRVASCDDVSVTVKLLFWMWVAQDRKAGNGLTVVGSGQVFPDRGQVETILTTPVLRVTPVSGLLVRSASTERVRRPSGVSKQLQHSLISCIGSNTKMLAQTLPLPLVFVPGLLKRTVASGAPAVLALAK